MRNKTYDLLLPIFNEIPCTFTGTSIVDHLNGTYTIYSCDTLWLSPNYKVTIDNVVYSIIDIEPNTWIKLKGSAIPSTIVFDIYTPYKFNGTVIAQNEIMSQIKSSFNKLPMIWLHEIVQERFEPDESLTLERESQCDLYFMVDAKFQDWTTPDHDKYAIKPMRNLAASFIETLRQSVVITNPDEIKFDQFDHAKFGVYSDNKGHTEFIFPDKLSGTQIRITIPFAKNYLCEC